MSNQTPDWVYGIGSLAEDPGAPNDVADDARAAMAYVTRVRKARMKPAEVFGMSLHEAMGIASHLSDHCVPTSDLESIEARQTLTVVALYRQLVQLQEAIDRG